MNILWIIFIVWTVNNAPLIKPFNEECLRMGGTVQLLRMSEFVLSVRCVKLIDKNTEKNDTREPKRFFDSYDT